MLMKVVIGWMCSLRFIYWSPHIQRPQVGERAFRKVIKVEVIEWAFPNNTVALRGKGKDTGAHSFVPFTPSLSIPLHAQMKNPMKARREGYGLPVREWGLPGNLPGWHFSLGLPESRALRNALLFLKPPRLGPLVMAAWADWNVSWCHLDVQSIAK